MEGRLGGETRVGQSFVSFPQASGGVLVISNARTDDEAMIRVIIAFIAALSFAAHLSGEKPEGEAKKEKPKAERKSASGPEPETESTTLKINPEAGAAHFKQVCANCHGEKGEGKKELMAPSIAAMPDWYVEAQIGKFQKDYRGTKPIDAAGITMHAIALTLDEAAILNVAAHVDGLKIIPTKNTLGADPKLGAEVFADTCMECHRYNGRGEPTFRSAQLIGLPDWYIVRQLKNFRDGVRGDDEEDIEGGKMHKVATRMEDSTFESLAAHIAVLAEKYAHVESRARLRRD